MNNQPVFPALEDERVEEGEAKQKLLVLVGLGDFLEALSILSQIDAKEVVADAPGRLVGELDAFLQQGDWEDVARRGRQPEAEAFMTRLKGLVDPL